MSNNREIYEKYFNINYKPKSVVLRCECPTLLNYIALTDIAKGTDREYDMLKTAQFYLFNILNLCESQDDFDDLINYLEAVAKRSDVGVDFYVANKRYISFEGRELANKKMEDYYSKLRKKKIK